MRRRRLQAADDRLSAEWTVKFDVGFIQNVLSVLHFDEPVDRDEAIAFFKRFLLNLDEFGKPLDPQWDEWLELHTWINGSRSLMVFQPRRVSNFRVSRGGISWMERRLDE